MSAAVTLLSESGQGRLAVREHAKDTSLWGQDGREKGIVHWPGVVLQCTKWEDAVFLLDTWP